MSTADANTDPREADSWTAEEVPRRRRSRIGLAVRVFVAAVGVLLAAGQIATVPSQGFRKLTIGLLFWAVAVVLAVSAARAVSDRFAGLPRRMTAIRLASGVLALGVLAGSGALALSNVTLSDPFLAPGGSSCGSAYAPVGNDLPSSDATASAMVAATMIQVDCEADIQERQGLVLLFFQLSLSLLVLAIVSRTRSQTDEGAVP